MDIKPGLVYKGADSTNILLSGSCILCMSVLSFILPVQPNVSMGIVAQMGQLPTSEQCQVILAVDYNHWMVQTSMSVSLCTKKSPDSSEMAFFVMSRILK